MLAHEQVKTVFPAEHKQQDQTKPGSAMRSTNRRSQHKLTNPLPATHFASGDPVAKARTKP
jgi:hypothetical protein